MKFSIPAIVTCFLLASACNKKPETLFILRSANETGVDFNNEIRDSDTFNILTDQYIYHGGGVAIADFNNDGLQDIFFTGNQVPNRLYLNKGGLTFEDVTDQANINVQGRWNSGVAVVDINQDGLMDLYVCATMKEDSIDRSNMLFINQGVNEKGIPTFTDKAKEYGIADNGFSLHAAFFDYDVDGDLDLYILTNQDLVASGKVPTNYRPKILDGSFPNTDKLYRNNGNGTFTNVSKEAGITIEGFALGIAISDFNKDGWPDMYISNDFLANDILYINKRDGSFENKSSKLIKHQSNFSMGNDAADINNDGRTDIITLDMLPETNHRRKTTIGNRNYLTYINNEKYGYEYQYMRNMLHVNNGVENEIAFSEVGQLAGVHQTEWSWGALFADFDNDGLKDLVITNGFPKDITDKDFISYRTTLETVASPHLLIDSIPVIKISNYIFKNEGDLRFKDVTKQWGMYIPSFSNGLAYADLDNDGDLDFIVNNINDNCFLYENTLYSSTNKEGKKVNNYLRFKLKGKTFSQGIKVTLYDSGRIQFQEGSLYRGYLSSVEDIIHFGLGNAEKIDSVLVEWPGSKRQLIQNVKANQLVELEYNDFKIEEVIPLRNSNTNTLIKQSIKSGLSFKHKEDDKIDYNIQRTLPHKFTQQGPGMAIADINGDGLDDIFVGGSVNVSGSLFVQNKNGFIEKHIPADIGKNKLSEDLGALFFDFDNDGDQDLYIVSGSFEYPEGSENYQDRLYLNDGKGNFTLTKDVLPAITASGSCVRAADFDQDGDLDLFVGGRVIPGKYPYPAESYLLRNDGNKFVNVTASVCQDLIKIGMVTDALWTDFNNDGKMDLMVVGEFMPITFFKNEGGQLKRISNESLQSKVGWWNSITAGDYDNDGDIDYVVGNLGLNNGYQVSAQYPMKVYAKDFDKNGSVDAILACYYKTSLKDDEKKLFPVHFWDEINTQSPRFRQQFNYYRQYASATMDKLLSGEDLKDALMMEANYMATSYVENQGDGRFEIHELPYQAQVAPVNGMITDDFNNDGNLDILMVGNDYGNEVFVGRYDAFTGVVLLGNGEGRFSIMPSSTSGFYVKGDAKAMVRLYDSENQELYVVSQNKDSLQVFAKWKRGQQQILSLQPHDSWAEITFQNGKKQRIEFYYGSGYLSQSSRRIKLPVGYMGMKVYDSKGRVKSFN